jgi:membrane fusion protein (multidrug efflux system)
MADNQQAPVAEENEQGQQEQPRDQQQGIGPPQQNNAQQSDQQQSGSGQRGQGPKKKAPDPRRKRTIRLVVLAVLVVALIVSIPVYAYYSVRESTDDAQVDGHVVPVSSRIGGTLVSVLVSDNELVRAGQELIRLDPADYQVAADQAQAQLANAEASIVESRVNLPVTNINTRSQVSTSSTQTQENRAGVAVAEQGINAARARVDSANAALQQAQANYVKSQRDLDRYKDLVSKDEISKQDYDAAVAAAQANAAQVDSAKAAILEAQHTLDQAVAQLAQAKARLATALVQERQSQEIRPQQIAASEARLKSAQAQVRQRQADLDQAKLNLGYTTIRASVDGIVSRKSAEPGMQVTPGQQVMALVPLDDIWVTANYKETQLRSMRVGQKAEVKVDTFGSGHKLLGHVDSIAAASGARFSLLPPENATGNFVKVVQRIPVKIVLEPGENRDRLLRPGMSVVPTVLLNSGTNNAY